MSALTRSDLAMVCRELGQALLRIGQQLAAPVCAAAPEPLPKPAAGPPRQQGKPAAAAEPAPSVPAKQAAAAGAPVDRRPLSPIQERVAAVLRAASPISGEELHRRLPDINPMSRREAMRVLKKRGLVRATGVTRNTLWHWTGPRGAAPAEEEAGIDEAAAIAQHLATKGVTKCPPTGNGPLPHYDDLAGGWKAQRDRAFRKKARHAA